MASLKHLYGILLIFRSIKGCCKVTENPSVSKILTKRFASLQEEYKETTVRFTPNFTRGTLQNAQQAS